VGRPSRYTDAIKQGSGGATTTFLLGWLGGRQWVLGSGTNPKAGVINRVGGSFSGSGAAVNNFGQVVLLANLPSGAAILLLTLVPGP
jgi:hypothetical protein